ncbi:putative calpain-like cysteine peptidase [Trypanosoma cruzi]|nr:putative calpain-like cysteine peptidase [Trypanosoma cruzi]
MDNERNRYGLKKDPRNATKVQFVEEVLQKKADAIAEKAKEPDISFLDPAPEGIPIQDMLLMGDTAFAASARERMKLKSNPVANASKISALEEEMDQRAHVLAKQLRAKERTFLDPEPEGVPLELLSLNENEALQELERELRALNHKPRKDAKAIVALENALLDRTNVLARELKENERNIFLDPQPEGVPVSELSLDLDEPFHTMEVERLRLRHEDPRANVTKIKELENALNDRAQELARLQLRKERAFQDPEPFGFSLEELGLGFDDAVVRGEAQLRELRKEPKKNAAAIKATEDEISKLVRDIARKKAALDRAFLDPEPEGRLVGELPLDEDKSFVAMDTKRRQLLRRDEDPSKVKALEEEMNDVAHEIARALNAKERLDYLGASPCGVLLEDLPLDLDQEFRELEAKRQQLRRDPRRKAALEEVEAALNARTEEIARRQLAGDRGYLDPAPAGVPLSLLPVDRDAPFQALEAKRAQLKKYPQRNAKSIRDVEDDLNDRAVVLADELKAAEREKFLNPKPNGVPIDDVPINNDGPFRDMEIQRLLLREEPVRNATAISNLEDAMNERAVELAANVLANERAFLDPEPLGIPLDDLPLDKNEEFLAMEAQLRVLRKDLVKNRSAIVSLEREMCDLAKEIAADELEKDRDFLDPEPEGRLLQDLSLRKDKEFHGFEKERYRLKKDIKKNAQKIADLEELMNERAHQVAKALNASERKDYLDSTPRGVPIDDLPLDTDEEFSKLEADRAQLMRSQKKHAASIMDLEDALNLRAEELAQEKLQEERSFMNPEPGGIPLKYLPLDEDAAFHEKEVERLALKAENLRRNKGKIKSIEEEMNNRANELAREMKLNGRQSVLEQAPKGVPLDVLSLDDDMPFGDLEVEYLKSVGDGEDNFKARNLADAMRKRAEDMAAKVKADNRMNLEQNPLGIPLEELPLDSNEEFDRQERKLFELMKESSKNAKLINDAMKRLNALVLQMAQEKAQKEREFLDSEPEGRYLSELPLSTDSTFLGLERQRRELKKNPYADEDRVADLEQMLNDRVHELAKKMNATERPNYLAVIAHGLPLSELPLDGDKEFGRLEAERAYFCHDRKGNASQIAKVEAALNKRAEEMAADAVRQDRMFLGDEVEGVRVRHLSLDDDPGFTRLETKRAALKNRDPLRNAKAVEDLEGQLLDRASAIAKELKQELRNPLDPRPLGIPLGCLPLNDDERFHALEDGYRELGADPGNRGKRDEIIDQLNERARELAQEMHDRERSVLDQYPEGVPLSALPLNNDEEFTALETETRALRSSPISRGRALARLKELEDAMNRRAAELANDSRKAFCDPEPEGIPLSLLGLGADEEFARMEEELRYLRRDPDANKETIKNIEFDLNNRAHEVAKGMLEEDRGYLVSDLCGVPLSALPIGSDPTFKALEVQRAKLRATDALRDARKIRDLEEKLNERLRVLAEEQKAEDLSGLDREPEGVPLSHLMLHEDDAFVAMVDEIRKLKKDPKRNIEAIEDMRDQMNDRVHEIAQEKLRADRVFLDKNPQGVPLDILPLKTDPKFRKLEAERAKLKAQDLRRNAGRIRDLEAQLNDRVNDLATEEKNDALKSLDQVPLGLPIALLHPHDDLELGDLLSNLWELNKHPGATSEEKDNLQRHMNARLLEMAAAHLERDRRYLEENPSGVPLELLPLTSDPGFHTLEVQRAILKEKDPRRNSARIADLEKKLNERASQLAEDRKRQELEGLDREPEGIPLSALDPHSNREFAFLVDQLRKMPNQSDEDPRVAQLKDEMNALAHVIAAEMKLNDRAFLDKNPKGVPLDILPLDTDPKFRKLEAERAKLKAQDPRRNGKLILDLENAMADRCHELAADQLREDLTGVDMLPRDIPLELLLPHSDPTFSALVDDLRALKRDPEENADAIEAVLCAMNDRADDLAAAQLDRGFLDQAPAGVPLEILPLDSDAEFHAMETARVKLKLSDPRRNAKKIRDLEEEMNARAHELAKDQLAEDLAGVDAAPEGIPLSLLKLTEDGVFASMVPWLRELKKDPEANAEQIRNLEDKMNNRAYELADALLEGDRGYLDAAPEGVPLEELPLTNDDVFALMEVERAKLKAQDPQRNAARVAELELQLNEMAAKLARDVLAEDLKGFASQYEGVATEQLKPHNDREFVSLVPELRRLKKEGPKNVLRNHMEEMDNRIREIAKEFLDGDLWFLDKVPEGVPLEYVPLAGDEKFEELRHERAALKADEPRKNADRIKECEDAMKKRSHELARDVKERDLDGIERKPYDIPLDCLPLREDPVASKLISRLREAKKGVGSPAGKGAVSKLQDELSERARGLAWDALAGDRGKYLDNNLEGVSLSCLPLDTDPQFHGLEVERAQLKLADPRGNAKRIEDAEERLNDRARELARKQLEDDIAGLDLSSVDMPMDVLRPHRDAEFTDAAVKLRELKKDPRRNEKKIRDLEKGMSERVGELMREVLEGDRAFLDSEPDGVPLSDLPINEDQTFRAKEVKHAELKARDPVKHADAIAALENELNQRVHELALDQLKEDLRDLDDTPQGVPIALLRPHDDASFASSVPMLRRLKKDPTRNAEAIRALENKLEGYVDEMAHDFLRADRDSYLDPAPLGHPTATLPLDKDSEFKTLEARRLELMLDPRRNKEEVAELEEALNARATVLAEEMLRNDRGFLEREPEGVPLRYMHLDEHRQFHELEVKRAALKAKDPVRNAKAIKDIEDELNDLVHELVRDQVAEDLRCVDPAPRGISINLLRPHDDPKFNELVEELRALKASPTINPDRMHALEAEMNNRAGELAGRARLGCRDKLDPYPEGLPLEKLPLDEDETFSQIELEMVGLKLADPARNAARVANLAEKLNDRALDIACAVKKKDLEGLEEAPRGIPLALLRPHNDEVFASLANEARGDGSRSRSLLSPAAADALNERARELADQLLQGDRGFLERDPEGIPLSVLPLDTDPVFREVEVERAVLKLSDPRKNADRITSLESRLNDRAHELAQERLSGDRGYLDVELAGVSSADLPLDEDPKFHQMEVERAKLKERDPVSNAYRIRDLEEKLNVRAQELAQRVLEEDLKGIDTEPEDVPLVLLHPHKDPEFASFLPDLRRLKKNSGRNAAPISAVQNKMNDRVHELAREMITEGRNSLDSEPEGVPLGYLPLDTDKQFGELEKKLYALQAAPRRNDGAIANLRERLNDRAHELAKEKIQGDRGFLEPEPEGIPLSDLPLDSDEKFHKMETERAKLKENPAKNADAIARMEKDLNDRVHEMAKELKEEVRAFLNTTSYGISKELLPLDKDRNFQGMEQQLRKLGRNSRQNAAAIESLREMLQDRADELGLQMLRGDRPKYLEPEYDGVEPVDVPVDDDKVFTELELERAIVKAKDPQSITDKIEELEGKLRDRFHELAKERIRRDRLFLDSEPEGIPLESVPLNDDADFRRLEGQLRKLSRDMRRNGPDISDTRDRLNDRAHELARGVVADDLRCLKDTYRGIPKEDLNLHKDAKFRDLANGRRRAARSRGALPAELTAVEGAMDARACEIADNCINHGRAFLDREPEGMDLADVPLDNDGRFAAMEAERRKRTKDPRSSRRNKDMIRDLEDDMIARSHALALEEFAKMRGFMDQEPEGVPLKEIPLDVDPEFRQAEVARYRMRKDPHHSPEEVAKLEDAMNDRARRLAKAILAKNRGFLDPEPCGVPLAELPLNTDEEFNKLAAERYRLKRSNKKDNNPEVKGIENEMNDRVHALAREHLRKARAFLNPEPEGVPLEDVPLGRDPKFLDMERGLARMRNDPNASAETLSSLEEDLNVRAHEVAREFLKKERAYLDPEPLGVLVEDLPLNHDPILNALERKRRELKKDPKRNGDFIRGCEDDIHDRVRAIAKEFLDNERRFLDPEPEGLPFSELPVDTDRQFRDLENERRALLKQPALNKAAIEGLEERMKTRVNELAKDTLRKCRAFLDPEPLGVPLDDLPLNTDEKFREMEFCHREMKKKPFVNAVSLEKLEDEMKQRARESAEELLKKERAFIDQEPEGCLLSELPLNKDKHFREMEKKLRELKKNPRKNLEEIRNLEYDMNDRVHELARRQLSDDKSYLPVEIYGVPVFDLPLNNDPEFHELERQRHNLKKDPKKNAGAIRETEDALNERALTIAEEFVRKERAYLDPEPEGVLLDRVPLNADRKFREMEQDRRRLMKDPNKKLEVKNLEERLNKRAHELARDLLGWQDEEFHESNKHMAEEWPRICELYPEGVRDPVVPEKLSSGDISSAPRNASFLAPFIAALGRHRVIIDRLFDSKEHPVNGPYSFIFYDPNSNPVRVEIDDRVPVDTNMEPKFTRVPKRSWYPLLLEKAYAKFVGGYSRLDQCTPHETLRDLTGRPVLHIPLDDKLAEAANTGDFRSVKFWGGVAKDLERGDLITCMSNVDAGDGIHPLCSYALFAVIETVKESNDPADIVIKLHNCYFDEPFYSGPLNRNDGSWKKELRDVCGSDPSEEEFLYLPQPVFLNNFSSMQRCHINCGDRLSSSGEWNECTSGGNPKFTTFRNNPIYLVENKSSRPVRILAELRHQTPSFSDSDGLNHYHQTGLVLMQSVHAKMAPTPLITSSTHRFIQKGMMLDAREVCSQMDLPPSTTCYLIPYTMKRGCHGKFNISVYPGMAKVTLTPLRYAGLKREPLMTNVVIPCGNDEGTRVDFLLNDPCDVHVLLRQIQISDPVSVKNGDIVAEEEVMLQVYNEYGINLATTANPSSAREQALIFRAPQLGRYSLRMVCSSKSKSDTCPCLLLIWVAKEIEIDFIPVPPDSKPLGLQARFPMIPRSAPNAFRTGSRERAYSRDRSVRRSDSLPPIQGAVRGGRGSQASFIPPRRPTGV